MSRSAIRTSALVIALALWGVPVYAQRPSSGDDESAALVGEGRAALRRGALDDAAKALDQAIALNPRRVEAYVLRSAVYAARTQYKQGVELMRRAQALAPGDEDVLTALGSHLVLSGDTGAGVPLLEQVVAHDPRRYDAELLLGHHWYAIGKWPEAIAALEAYFVHRPRDRVLAKEDGQHRVELADAYLRDRQADKALDAFRQAAREGERTLRTRLGVAWATAAVDCSKAQALLRELEPVADAYPEVWLVEGQCALALGDSATALERARRYIDRAPKRPAAGHALLGEVQVFRGDLIDARREFEEARALEPARRRWTVRLAYVLRHAGDAGAALAALDAIAAPVPAASDPDWWSEVGQALLASNDPQAVITRLAPVVADLPASRGIHAVLGAAQLATGQAEAAGKLLDEAEAIAGTHPSQRALLAGELATAAVARLAAGDAATAEPLLTRAARLAGSATIQRDLGIAWLALDHPREALVALDRAIALDPAPITRMLEARAHFAIAGDLTRARSLYKDALGAAPPGPDAVEISIDWAASELAGGDPSVAVGALEKTARWAIAEPLARRHRGALAAAQHAAGLQMLRAGYGARAVDLLKASLKAPAEGTPDPGTTCDLALAAIVTGDANTATAALRTLGELGGRGCWLPAPADQQVVPILSAFAEGLNPRQAGRALERLTALAGKSSGVAAVLLNTAIRIVALVAADEAYRNGNLAQARKFVNTARAASARAGGEEVAHDLALLDLADDKLDAAIGELERLAPRSPEALVALGIAYERRGDPEKALEIWQQASKAGVRFAPLPGWIEAKERFYGEQR